LKNEIDGTSILLVLAVFQPGLKISFNFVLV